MSDNSRPSYTFVPFDAWGGPDASTISAEERAMGVLPSDDRHGKLVPNHVILQQQQDKAREEALMPAFPFGEPKAGLAPKQFNPALFPFEIPSVTPEEKALRAGQQIRRRISPRDRWGEDNFGYDKIGKRPLPVPGEEGIGPYWPGDGLAREFIEQRDPEALDEHGPEIEAADYLYDTFMEHNRWLLPGGGTSGLPLHVSPGAHLRGRTVPRDIPPDPRKKQAPADPFDGLGRSLDAEEIQRLNFGTQDTRSPHLRGPRPFIPAFEP